MGGDKLVAAVAGDDAERAHGDELRDAWVEEFEPMLDEIRPFDGARELLENVAARGFRLVLASSGKKAHVEAFLDLFGGRDLADGWTTSDDVDASKPDPDLVAVALEKVGGSSGVMIGDSVWDAVAAAKLDIPTLAVLTGGFSREELTDAGASRVYESLPDLTGGLDATPLARAD